MATSTPKPAPQQQGGGQQPSGQMGGNSTPAPQQGQAPIIRDWAAF